MKKNVLIGKIGWNVLSHIMERGGLVLMTVIFSRNLSKDDFVEFGAFQLTITMLASFSVMGIAAVSAKTFAQFNAQIKNPSAISSIFLLSVFSGCVFSLFGILMKDDLFVGLVPANLIFIGLMAISIGVVINGGVYGLGLFKHAAIVSLVAFFITIVFALFAIYSGSLNLSLMTVVIYYAAITLLNFFVIVKYSTVSFLDFFVHANLKGVLAIMKSVGPLAMVTLLASSSNWIMGKGVLIYTRKEEFGFFIIGLQWYALVQLLPSMIARATFPNVVDEILLKKRIGFLKKTSKWSFLMALLMVGVVFVSSHFLVGLYGGEDIKWHLFFAYSLAALPISLSNMYGNILIASGKETVWFFMMLIWFISLVFFGYCFRSYGAYGVAVALFVAGGVISYCSWYFIVVKYKLAKW